MTFTTVYIVLGKYPHRGYYEVICVWASKAAAEARCTDRKMKYPTGEFHVQPWMVQGIPVKPLGGQ